MGEFIYTVGDVNRFVQQILSAEEILSGIRVRGELSNYKVYASGHRYFSLKDQTALVRCVWFRGDQRRGADAFRDGMRVVLRGDAGLYVRDGQYQITVRDMVPDGAGQLYERFERLKAELAAEGLFDPARKRPLPPDPRMIGVVTSAHGAAVRDIIRVTDRRGAGVRLVLYPVQVQGEGAARQIAEAIDWFSRQGTADLLIVGRGGGSIEDLWAFNEEAVARAIANCSIPVISAVGHETDFTIADFAADVRAATPSAAAELAVPSRRERAGALASLGARLNTAVDRRLGGEEQRLGYYERILPLTGPEAHIEEKLQRLDGLSVTLERLMDGLIREAAERTRSYERILASRDPGAILRRGYAMIRDASGAVVSEAGALTAGQAVRIVMRDGQAEAHIDAVREKERI